MQVWKKGSKPPPGEYEFKARTGGRLRVWVGDEMVFVNGETKTFEQIFQAGQLTGPIEGDHDD